MKLYPKYSPEWFIYIFDAFHDIMDLFPIQYPLRGFLFNGGSNPALSTVLSTGFKSSMLLMRKVVVKSRCPRT